MRHDVAKKDLRGRDQKKKKPARDLESASGYSLEFSKNGTNSDGAAIGKVRLLQGGSVVVEQDAFSGGNGFPAVLDGRYRVNLTIRGDESTNKVNPDGTLAPFFGIQLVSDHIPGDDGNIYNGQTEWGHIRARMNPSSGTDHGDYLHGKKRTGDWTHGCVCDRTDNVAQALWGISGPPYPVLDFTVSTSLASAQKKATPKKRQSKQPSKSTKSRRMESPSQTKKSHQSARKTRKPAS